MTTSTSDNLTAAVIPHDTLWCIEPTAGRRLWDQLKQHSMRQHVTVYAAQQGGEKRPPEGGRPADRPYQMEGPTAIFSLMGPMTKAPTSWSSGTSTVRLRRQIDLARQDSDVTGAVLVIDSPGGSVSGTADLAAEIAKFAVVKPIVAYVEDCCCSAALWCATQCSAVYANATALVGSQGTVMVLDDSSRLYQNAGIEPVVFATGKYKGAGAEGAPITPEQRAHFQSIVDGLNAHFVAAVRRGRPAITDAQMAAIAEAGIYVGSAAIEIGLIDGIATLADALTAARGQMPRSAGIRAETGVPRTGANRGSTALTGNDPPKTGKEINTMRAKLAAALTAVGAVGLAARILGANTDDPQALAAIVEEATPHPPASGGRVDQPSVCGGQREDDATLIAMKAMQATAEAQTAQLKALQEQLAAVEAQRLFERDCEAIMGLVRQARMTPAQAEGWKDVARTNHAAFEAALPQLKTSPVLTQLRTAPSNIRPVNGSPGEQLAKLAAQMAKETGRPLAECAVAVAHQHPDLAQAHHQAAPSYRSSAEVE
jgi:signal peptide peptidase SppA